MFSSSDKLSVSFLGTALNMTIEDKKDKYYRKMHIKNINMPQFILGDNIGLIVFNIEQIIVSDNQDQVKHINGVSQ